YLSPKYFPGRAPIVLRTGTGIVHQGVVVDASGQPVAGASVGVSTVHRGPWTRTGADGSFTLCGLSAPMDMWVHVGGRRILFEEDGVEAMRLQLPSADGDDEDGVQVVDLTDEQRQRRDRGREREEAQAEARERSWPLVSVRTVGFPEDGSVILRTRSRSWDVTDAVAAGEPVRIPDDECVFWLHAEDSARVLPVDRRAATTDGALKLRWFQPTRVEGRVLDEGGEPLSARAYIGPPGGAAPEDRAKWQTLRGALSLPTVRTGPVWLFVEAAEQPGVRILTIDLPGRGDDAFVDVGDVVVRGQPAHRFDRSDGTPLEEGSVQLLRAGWMDFEGHWTWRFEADADGNFWLPDLEPGDALLVRSEPPADAGRDGVEVVSLPSRFVIGEDAPSVFRMHGGEARVEVDAGDEHVYAMFGDRVVPIDGPTVVRGLEERVYQVLVGAGVRRGVAVRADVRAPAPGVARTVLRATLR
ncbi:MAG: carboxypeptidase-like regulatory domain-containing protein, partial [Planctomycetota bacterium]|nr:carboxypeptidase-like regulatory domain-containing protein [Planctomycetota bacterium]